MAEQQSISIADIGDKFIIYHDTYLAVETAIANNETLGPKPPLPEYVDSDDDYNDVIDARNQWVLDYGANNSIINSGNVNKVQQERDVMEITPPNTWVRIDGLAGDSVNYFWVGYNTNDQIPGYTPELRWLDQDAAPAVVLVNNLDDPIGLH